MNEEEARHILLQVFLRLRRIGLGLGIRELLDALRVVDGGWGESPEELRQVARLLWSNSIESMRDFDDVWAEAAQPAPPADGPRPEPPRPTPPPQGDLPYEEAAPPPPSAAPSEVAEPELSALPVQPPFTPVVPNESVQLDSYWPVSRRSMSYTWRYLRRMVPDGPQDVPDMKGTVERAARQGFYLAPVFRRRLRNYAKLVLLLDQGGSMVPFHRFTRDVAETAVRESNLAQVEVYYFHNVVADDLYRDPHLTERVSLDAVTAGLDAETSVLIVSDGGAARGFRRLPRIQATAEFLARLRQHTTLVAWLNPMPSVRWANTTAAGIGYLVKMYQMDPDGFSSSIDVMRGQEF